MTDLDTPLDGAEPAIADTTSASHQSIDSRQTGAATRRFRQRKEAARDRDVFRNLCAWSHVYKCDVLPIQSSASIDSREAAQQCPDKTLIALAQLCALQLNTRSCLVSLACRTTEYVLADISRTTALQQESSTALDGNAWIGTTSFNRDDGLTGYAVEDWQKARRPRSTAAHTSYYSNGRTPHYFLVDDVQSKPQYSDLGLLRRGPWIRFYCSVPLRSGQGSVIGALTIMDDRPRFGVSAHDLTLLEGISDSIVQHLHATVLRMQQQRSERLLQGLSCFNYGGESLRDWWLAQDDARADNLGRNTEQGSMADRNDRVNAEFGVRDPLLSPSLHDNPAAPADDSEATGSTASQASADRAPQARRDGSNLSITAAYNRASNLLREALSVDAVAFINMNSTISRSDIDSDPGDDTGDSGSDLSDGKLGRGPLCQPYSYSTRQTSSIDGHDNTRNPVKLRERHMQRLVQHYPQGAVFYFQADGRPERGSDTESGVSDGSDHNISPRERRLSRDVEMLGKAVEGIRSAVLYPMWDSTTRRWRSCIIVWSQSLTRLLDRAEDLAYVRTFGHSILAEVSRLESMAANHAKTKFISTVSHELRSPLHAILASVEFLQDTELDTFQQEMASAISLAGKTLLDTYAIAPHRDRKYWLIEHSVDHILDYSKISNSTRASKADGDISGKAANMSMESEASNKVPVVDLARLTEGIVETCVSAHRSQMHANRTPIRYRDSPSTTSSYTPAQRAVSDVSVTLNVAYRKHWMVEVQPGAWTRILTNLVGNALKYTHKGSISVRLEVLPSTQDQQGISRNATVLLVVEDTGIGISESFLADGAFIPFKQEDPHSTGTGLGLSIVNQIARDMGADLKLSTKRHKGTRLELRLTLNFMPDDPKLTSEEAQHGDVNMKVDRFHLLTLRSSELKGPDADNAVAESVRETAREWMSSEICEDMTDDEEIAHNTAVCAITEQTLKTWQCEKPESLQDTFTKLAKIHSHILVLAESIQSMQLHADYQDLPLQPVFVHQPIGPHKLLRAIASDHDSTVAGRAHSPQAASSTSDGKKTPPANDGQRTEVGSNERDVREKMALRTFSSGTNAATTDVASSISLPSRARTSSFSAASSSFLSQPTTQSSISKPNMVLLVEDNHINMQLLVALVRKLKLPYRCAVNGREAVDMYRQDRSLLSVVLMDMSMPVMDGFSATSKIRDVESRQGLPRIYIVALTGVTDPEAKARAFDCGVDDFFSKPVSMKELKAVMSRVKQDVTEPSTDEPGGSV